MPSLYEYDKNVERLIYGDASLSGFSRRTLKTHRAETGTCGHGLRNGGQGTAAVFHCKRLLIMQKKYDRTDQSGS